MKQEKKWQFAEIEQGLQEKMSASLSVSRVLAGVLIQRGFCDAEAAGKFLRAEGAAADPFLFVDMEAAVQRIRRAAAGKEKVIVYGDYDVDGITSTALLLKTLKACGLDAAFYIPEREKEGYGINEEALAAIAAGGASLLITVDCGISAAKEIAMYRDRLDIIVTDHHMLPEVLPQAFAILNPKMDGCAYPEKELAGVGVTYKLCQALCAVFGVAEPEDALEIAALGTVADVVPLLGENREIVKHGLAKLNQSKNMGIKALLAVCNLADKEINSGHVGFILAPRLNAAGRLGSAAAAVELLTADDENNAKALARDLNFENEQRQLIEKEILAQARAEISGMDLAQEKVLVVAGEGWNAGVIGIVASRLVDAYYRPSIVMAVQDGMAKGSCRSIPGYQMYEALKASEDLLAGYGGHAQAAGFTILPENIPLLRRRLNEFAKKTLREEDYVPIVKIDAKVDAPDVSEAFIEELACLEPFGMGNPRPLFAMMDTCLFDAKSMGRDGAHLRFKVGRQGEALSGIAWNMGLLVDEFAAYGKVDIAFQPELNEWQGQRSVQVKAQDIRRHKRELTEVDRLFLAAEQEPYQDIGEAKQFFTKAVGVSFDGRQAAINRLQAGDAITLRRNAQNTYDKNAIVLLTAAGEAIGFIRAPIAAKLSPLIDAGQARYGARVTDVTGSADTNFGVNLHVFKIEDRLPFKQKIARLSKEEACRVILGGRPYHEAQQSALAALENRRNTFVIMGTGRGKSAIFQTYAAMASINQQQMTVIVYPLRALVNDQYLRLKELFAGLGIAVYKGNGTLSVSERGLLSEALADKAVDVFLTTPEFLEANLAALHIKKQDIGLFVVDECHHIAKDTRRAAYRSMDKLVKALGSPLVLGVTATADGAAAGVIKRALAIEAAVIDKTVRENLAICDQRGCRDKAAYISGIVKKSEKALVFVNSRKKAVEIAAQLRESHPEAADRIGFYHAGLSNEWRAKVEKWFKEGVLQVVVATSAFGEGVDIPDIRHVLQYHLPFDRTSFNQQCGRAGRDGNSGLIHLLFGQEDLKLNGLILKERAPERDLIGKVYLVLKNSRDGEGKIEMTNAAIAKLCDEKYKTFIGEAGVSACLKILEELRLLSREVFAGARTIFFHPAPAAKMDLMQSPAYVEGMSEREEFEEFAGDVLHLPEKELLGWINKPIYPEN